MFRTQPAGRPSQLQLSLSQDPYKTCEQGMSGGSNRAPIPVVTFKATRIWPSPATLEAPVRMTLTSRISAAVRRTSMAILTAPSTHISPLHIHRATIIPSQMRVLDHVTPRTEFGEFIPEFEHYIAFADMIRQRRRRAILRIVSAVYNQLRSPHPLRLRNGH